MAKEEKELKQKEKNTFFKKREKNRKEDLQ
jgi:hypothetical protein